MALVSPGVQVTVIDESFYTPAEPGTTPLIVVATGQDKLNAAGTGTAQGTLKANAGKAFRMTSQRDVVDFFGVPFFEKTPSATPIHGSERNEYGLLAAFSFMGVSSAAFIVRANVNLDELQGTPVAPGSEPDDGKWWVDTNDTSYGIQEWNGASALTTGGQKFSTKFPLILTDDDSSKIDTLSSPPKPKGSVGSTGDYAVVWETVQSTNSPIKENARIFYKSAGGGLGSGVLSGDWVLVGSNDWVASHPTVLATAAPETITAGGRFLLNGSTITVGSDVSSVVAAVGTGIAGVTAKNVNGRLYLYSNGGTETTSDSTKSGNISISAYAITQADLDADDPGVGGPGLLTGLAVGDTWPAAAGGNPLATLGIEPGTYYPPALQMTPHTNVPQWKDNGAVGQIRRPTGSVWIKTTEPGGGARVRVRRWSSANKAWQAIEAPIYDSGHAANFFLDRSGGGKNIGRESLYTQINPTEHYSYRSPDTNTEVVDETLSTAELRVFIRQIASKATSSAITGTTFGLANTPNSFQLKQSSAGSSELSAPTTISFLASSNASTNAERIAAAINAASYLNAGGSPISNRVQASINDDNSITITHLDGGEIRFIDGNNNPISAILIPSTLGGAGSDGFYLLPAGALEQYLISAWKPLATFNFAAQNSQPLNEPNDGQLWYNNSFSEVDIMIHDGNTWRGYNNVFPNANPSGAIVAASIPTSQTDGTALVTGDLWISTADLENFPTIYRYDATQAVANRWQLIDKTDQITDEGILFADARWADSGNIPPSTVKSIADLAVSDYLDPDAPDPSLYPRGMLLWNLRRSGGNVKKYNNNYIDLGGDNPRFNNNESMSGYASDRWTTASPNNEDGSGSFGRKAQRKVVVMAMKSVIDTSEEIRDEERRNFNLIAAPGYPEVLSNLINLNIDRGLTAFVLGDTPLRLRSDATTLINWGTNANLVFDNGDDGIVSFDEYCAVYYPNGFTTDLGGSNAVVPATHMMLRTIALSDQVSYPWFAPAGTRRGGITNATAVGYIDSLSGEFQTVALNEGTRDVLYDLKVNPIPFFVGVGLVAYGQKTRARNASALDRINVARLVVYLRSQLQKLARPYIFEPNDQITRDEIKGAVESLLLELVGLRALFDFAVVCDESNNTPSRIDRNELYVDIAIEPVKAVEFIYIPLRIKNTGEI
jgi:hypothetical protein